MVRKNINIVIACFQIKGKNIIVFGQGTLDGTQALTIKLLFNCMQINMPQIQEKSLFIPLASKKPLNGLIISGGANISLTRLSRKSSEIASATNLGSSASL